MSLVVKAKVKDVAKGHNVAGDFAEALSNHVQKLVDDAVKRADANGRKTVMAKDVAYAMGAKKAADNLVVKAAVKEAAKGANVAGDFAEALNNVANWMVKNACERADANGRKTVMAKDL